MTTRIGIYGGTFDPVHLGHLILARDAVEQLELDRLVFIPAAISPHKLAQQPHATGGLRLEMLAAALQAEARFAVDDCELGRAGPSFTIDTVLDLGKRQPAGAEFFYLVGEDNLRELHTWHRIDELGLLVKFVVFRRGTTPSVGADSVVHGYPVLPRRVDISSTEIRKRVAAGRSIRYLVPDAVADVIEARRLYRPQEGAAPLLPKN